MLVPFVLIKAFSEASFAANKMKIENKIVLHILKCISLTSSSSFFSFSEVTLIFFWWKEVTLICCPIRCVIYKLGYSLLYIDRNVLYKCYYQKNVYIYVCVSVCLCTWWGGEQQNYWGLKTNASHHGYYHNCQIMLLPLCLLESQRLFPGK